MTVKEMFEEVRGIVAGAEIEEEQRERALAFLETRIAQVTAKNASRSNKPTKTQVENMEYENAILEGMAEGASYTVTEIQRAVQAVSELSNQRVSRMMRHLVDKELVTRSEVKGKAYFSKV